MNDCLSNSLKWRQEIFFFVISKTELDHDTALKFREKANMIKGVQKFPNCMEMLSPRLFAVGKGWRGQAQAPLVVVSQCKGFIVFLEGIHIHLG